MPFPDWIGDLGRIRNLRADLFAGIAVALVLVPQSMAYAQLAGLPVRYGLYAAFLPAIVGALFGSSRQLATGPVALVSLMTATALAPLAAGSPDGYLAYALLLAFMVGALQLFLGLFRLGALVDLLSRPALIGFADAAALIIAATQLGRLLGIDAVPAAFHYETLPRAAQTLLEQIHLPSLWMGFLALSMIYALRGQLTRFPGILVVVAVTTLLSRETGFQAAGGRVVGEIAAGLPDLALPVFDWNIARQLLAAAVTIAVIGSMESLSLARAMAMRTRHRLDADRELIGQGLANLAAGCFGGYPVAGSSSRSRLNLACGAVTGFSSVVAGLGVFVTLLWLTPALHHLPQPTLAAIVVVAAVDLVKLKPIVHAWRVQPHDGVVATLTFLLTLVMAPRLDRALLVGALVAIGLFLYRSLRPRVAVLSRFHDGTMRDIAIHDLPTSPSISVIRFDGSLFFANAGYFESKVLEVVAANPQLRYLVVDGEGIHHLDATGEEVLQQLARRLGDNGTELLLARMKRRFMDTARRTGLVAAIGEDRFFSRIQYALDFAWDGLGPDYDRSTCPLRNPNL